MKLEIDTFSDGALVLTCHGSEPEALFDLVFAMGAMDNDDPDYAVQRAYLERIVAACAKEDDAVVFDELRADVDSVKHGRVDFIKDHRVVATARIDVERGRVTPRDTVVIVARANGRLSKGGRQ
jgi:hypothetical protein